MLVCRGYYPCEGSVWRDGFYFHVKYACRFAAFEAHEPEDRGTLEADPIEAREAEIGEEDWQAFRGRW